jgi:phosphogluconate dehydratase
VYPNGQADINHFHAAGGTGLLFRELLDAGLMHADARTVWGDNFSAYTQEPYLEGDHLAWRPAAEKSLDPEVLATAAAPFSPEGGLRLLTGNLGRGVIKVSAVKAEHRRVSAPAVVIDSQQTLVDKFEAGELARDCIVVVRFQGPRANGMPELHKLTPLLGSLLDKGFAIALVTDGRMSGASGKVPAAIHVTPEAAMGGPLARLRDGDMLTLDAAAGTLHCEISEEEMAKRPLASASQNSEHGVGRELFGMFRKVVSTPEAGASVIFAEEF